MVAFVLIHSPLVGPVTWGRVAEVLRERGFGVAVPSLVGCGPPYWRNHVARIMQATARLDGERMVAVAHSGAGPLLPLVAEQPGDAVETCLYVDAMLPTGGGSRIEHVPAAFAAQLRGSAVDGLMPAWGESWPPSLWAELIPDVALRAAFRDELVAVPLALYTEPIPEPDVWVRSVYLQFSDAYKDEAAMAASRGWAARRINGGHLHMLVEPAAVADALIALATGE